MTQVYWLFIKNSYNFYIYSFALDIMALNPNFPKPYNEAEQKYLENKQWDLLTMLRADELTYIKQSPSYTQAVARIEEISQSDTRLDLSKLDLWDEELQLLFDTYPKVFMKIIELDLGNNSDLTNISWVGNFPNLKALIANHNAINNIVWLENLINLAYLSLGNNQIKDVEPLRNLSNLMRINLDKNNIINMESLHYFLEKWNMVSYYHNPITNN